MTKHKLRYSFWSAKITWCDICKKHFYDTENDEHILDEKKAETKVVGVEARVKPACEIGRPQFRDYLPADTTTQMITDIFLNNKELHRYIVALDEYIDELESKSV